MTLTAQQRIARDGRVTASFIPALMKGDEAKIIDKWRELVGDPAWVDTYDGDPWLSHYGSVMEPILLDWRQQKIGKPITRRGEVAYHPTKPWASCTLDGFSPSENAVIQTKTANRWVHLDKVMPNYIWQVLYEIGVTGADRGIIYLSEGGLEPEDREVKRDPEAEAEMWARAAAFWKCVETVTPPSPLPELQAPVDAIKIVDMTASNVWGEHAQTWLDNLAGRNRADAAEKSIKKLIPADAARAFGHGVVISRNRAGHLSLRESK